MLKKKFPSLASIGSDGNTAFLRAARAGHLDKVLEQLKNNVDINTSNANGLNALHLASKDGHINVVSELLKRGAKVDSATKKGNTALHIASLAGQEEVVKHLVEHGASVNVQSQNGFTPLYMAAQENHDAVVRFLLANGANQSLATEDGFTPLAVAMQQGHDKVVAVLLENDTRGKVRLPALHIAAKKDDCKAAALLLQNEHNPDVTSKSGFTPLHIASHYGNEAIANLLLSKNADVNYAAKHNITPLHVAAKWGKANMVSVLLSRGANIEAKTRDGLTPLHCAARSGHEQVVDMLLERGAPISAKTKNGLAALHMSSQGDHVDAARILLYHRAPVDDVTVDYLTALHVAAHCGHVGVARLLLDRKADPNARALNGFTPLHIACKKNRIKVVELLLKHGASIEATTESGLTPLHVASFMGCMNIVIYLVQNEAGPDVKTVRGETPLHLAARANQTDIIRILLRNGAQVDARAREQQTPLHIASRLGNVDIVMLLLQHGASVDSTTKDLYTALHIAAKEGQDEVASVLLENGASLEATTKKGFTPLHLAAKYGHMNVAKLLLRRDAPVDAQGKNGVTPLHVASHYDHQNVALLLLEKGASPHATAKNGHTPLHIAARKNQMDIATTLLEYGAKANAESKAGFTPLHLSAQEGHSDMSNLLIEHQADVNHKAKNGLTPLHLCSQEDRVEVGSILLKNESDINSTTKAGYTPLHVACHFGQMGMVRLLLANGASVTPTTAVNYTPLHQAAQQGHSVIVNELLAAGADPNATTNQGQTAMSIAQKLGYISVMETLKSVTDAPISPTSADEKYKVVSPETMQETFMSDSEDEGGEDTMLSEQPYHYLTVDEMKGLGDDSLPIDVTRDERDNRDMGPPNAIDDTISPQHMKETYTTFAAADNVDINRHPLHVGFLVSFLVDARGGAMRGVRHSGVRVIVPPRRASMPLRVTCRYLKRDKLPHPPPLMEGEALASRILELGPVGAKFLGPVMIEVPHFGSLRGKEREIVILRSDNGETWREHTFEASEEAVHDVLSSSFEKDELSQYEENPRMTRILTTEFPHYIAVVSRVRQEVHAIGPEGGMVSSTVVPQVQAVFPHGALTKKIKVGLQAQPIPADLTAKLLGNRVAVSPIVTVEPRRRKFHKPISLTIPVPQAANKGMINQYSGDAPTLRLLCSITGGTTRAQWEDVTGSTPLTFVNDCVSFTTTVSARFWLMDCRNITEATKMATELYREAIHVPFMAKFVVFAKRVDTTEARLRVFCMTDDKEDKTLEHQEHFSEVAKSRDVEVLEGKTQYLEFAGNLVPVTKSGEQLQLGFRAFKENRLPFTVRVKDPHADAIGRTIFMREPKVAKGDVPQQPICILNIVLPEEIIPEPDLPEHEAHKHSYITHTSGLQRLSDISNLLGEDWIRLAGELGVSTSEVNSIKTELCESSVAHQGLAMLRLWLQNAGNKASASSLEQGLKNIGRDDIIQQTVFQMDTYAISEELSPSYTTKHGVFKRIPGEKREIIEERRIEERIPKDEGRDVSIGEKTPQIDERIPKKDERRMTIDKDDGDEKKYVAEEKAVEEESLKSVSERKKEIEKRLSQDVEDKTIRENVITKDTKTITKETRTSKEIVVTKETTSTKELSSKEVITEKSKKLLVETSEKETAEEKAVSPEPAHLSFDEKRKSFEMGITPKEKIKQQDSLTEAVKPQEAVPTALIAEVSKVTAQEVKKEIKVEEREEEEEEREMSFAEKRRSFEQGLTMKQPGDTLPAAERKKEAAIDRKAEEQKKVSDFRRDSELFQEVSQGLDNIEKGIMKPAAQELLSPGVARTPPPSPADFIKDAPDNKKWSVETTSNLLSGQDDKPRGAYKSKEAVESSWLSRQGERTDEGKKTAIQVKESKELVNETKIDAKPKCDEIKKEPTKKPSIDRKDSIKKISPDKTLESSKKGSQVKTDKKPIEKRNSKKTPSPEKTVSKVSTTVTKVKSPEESTTVSLGKNTLKSQISQEKVKTDSPKKDSTVKEKVIEKGNGKQKTENNGKSGKIKEDQMKLEENISKQIVDPARATEKKSTILGKTIETIKKPFQDKGEDKVDLKDEKGKGKGKGKQKLTKAPTLDTNVVAGNTHERTSIDVDENESEVQPIKHETEKTTEELIEGSLGITKYTEINKDQTSDETVNLVSDEKVISSQSNDKSKDKGQGVVPKLQMTTKTASQKREESPKDTKDAKSKLKDNGKGKDGGSPKETKGKGKTKEKIESTGAQPIAEKVSTKIDKSSEDQKNKGDRDTIKQAISKGKGKSKIEQTNQQSPEREPVVEQLIEKTVNEKASIAVAPLEVGIEDTVKIDDDGRPKDDKSKGKGKGKIKDKSGLSKNSSMEESDKSLKPDTSLVGKAVEIIKKPFQDQTKPMEGKKPTEKTGKGKKQKSIESTKTPSVEEDDKITTKLTETSSLSQTETEIEKKSVELASGDGTKKTEKVTVKDDKIKNKGKGKQNSVESNKSLEKVTQNEPNVEATLKEQTKDVSPEPSKKDDKKKGKNKQKPVETSKKPSIEKSETSLEELPTPEPTVIQKTLETIKRPFQGQNDEKPTKERAKGKREGKSEQKSLESASQSSTEQETKEETIFTTETVRLIKELSQDKSGQLIERQSIDLVTKPFGDKVSLPKSSDFESPTTLIEDPSRDKTDRQIEGLTSDLLRKTVEIEDIELNPSGKTVKTPSTVGTLTKDLSEETFGPIIAEKGIDIVSQPLEETLRAKQKVKDVPSSQEESARTHHLERSLEETHKIEGEAIELVSQLHEQTFNKATPSVEPYTTKMKTPKKEFSDDKDGRATVEKKLDLVTKPLETMHSLISTSPTSTDSVTLPKFQETDSITGPLLEKLHQEKSGFIIEERPIDVVSQPFQYILSADPHSSGADMTPESTKLIETQSQIKTQDTGPLIKELHHKKSGFIIEERPIDVVSQPFQYILSADPHSSGADMSPESTKLIETQSQIKTQDTGPLIEELHHKKSGFIIEERPIDLVSQPFQDILEASKSTELPPSGMEGHKSAVSKLEERPKDTGNLTDSVPLKKHSPCMEESARARSLIAELSQDEAGQVIEDGAISLVAQPFLEGLAQKKDSSNMKKKDLKATEEQKKRDEPTTKKTNFEHIQKTIDDAKTQFDQFVGIVAEKAEKSTSNKINGSKDAPITTSSIKTTIEAISTGGKSIMRSNDSQVEIPVEKEEDFLNLQKTIQQGSIEENVKKVSETSKESEDGRLPAMKPSIDLQIDPVKDSFTTSFEKPKIAKSTLPEDSLLDFGEITQVPITNNNEIKGKLNVQESVQQGIQNVPLESIEKIEAKTIITTVIKPIEQGAENVLVHAEKVGGVIDKNNMKGSEPDEKSVDDEEIVLEKNIEQPAKPSIDTSTSLVEKTIVTVLDTLPKDRMNTQSTFQQVLENIPSENIGISDKEPIKTTSIKSIERGAENISVPSGKVEINMKKVTETLKTASEAGGSMINQTIEMRVKPLGDELAIKVEKNLVNVQEPLDDGLETSGKLAHKAEGEIDQFQTKFKGGVEEIGKGIEAIDLDTIKKVTHELSAQMMEDQSYIESSESLLPEFGAESFNVATFETVETIFPTGSGKGEMSSTISEVTVSSNDEIGRIIKEMESQLLSTKFGMDDCHVDEGSEVGSDDYVREVMTMPTTPMPARKHFEDKESISESEESAQPYVTTPTLSRRAIGVGGSQRLTQDERPVVKVTTEYVGDLSESEAEEDAYIVLEPEVKERRKFKIRFSPDMYGSEDKEDMEESHLPGSISECLESTIEPLKKSDSKKSEKNITRIERKFERMTSQTKEADPSMSEVTDGEFQKMVSQLSLEEVDQALHQWDAGGLTPSEIDSKDLTLSSDDTTSPLQQGLTDIFRPKLSSILPTSVYMEQTGTELGSSGLSESSKMKLSLVKDSVPQIFQSIETDSHVRGDSFKSEQEQKQTVETHRKERDEESQEGAFGGLDSKLKGTKK